MADQITLKLTVDSVAAAQSVKELKQVIRDATTEALKFKEGSAEFAKFSQIAAQAKDKMQGVREQMMLLDPDAKIRAFTSLGNAIVGGFTAAQGAAALFGANVEDVQKAMLKVQSAMALLQGFQAVQDGIKAFTQLRGVIMLTISSMSILKTALIATGIGALAVLFGTIASEWDKLKKTIEISFPTFNRLAAFWNTFKEVAFGSIASVVAGVKQLGMIIGEFFKGNFGLAVMKAKEFPQVIAEAYTEAVEIYNQPDLPEAIDNALVKPIDKAIRKVDELMEKSKKAATEIADVEVVAFKRSTDAASQNLQQRIADKEAFNRLDLQDTIDIANAKQQIEQSTFATVASLGNTFIKNQQKLDAFNKKVAAAQVIVNQAKALSAAIEGATAAAAATGPAAPFVLGAYIASAVASITAIFAGVKSLLSKAGSTPGVSLDTGSIGVPSSNISGNVPSGVNFLEQPSTTLTGNTQQPPPQPIIIQNIISETDITGVQNGVNAIVTQATIG